MEDQSWWRGRHSESISELSCSLAPCAWPETQRLERLESTQRVNVHPGGVEDAIRQVETRPISSQVQGNVNLGATSSTHEQPNGLLTWLAAVGAVQKREKVSENPVV
ncbi:hypothetical protein V3481_008471 [Fusarium oxysporum f. sp. vasinfectum]|uniref:Uncharacterized protein n=1 Tax=Fusarium oxysporum f. sp. vasinfectum 25433 TaxID=1089449 RepID=X0MI39_FUSOX|nr:hypothetical protein FOTG_03174 [Fusarium oxysporum f. sp. vasinfectum 25433]